MRVNGVRSDEYTASYCCSRAMAITAYVITWLVASVLTASPFIFWGGLVLGAVILLTKRTRESEVAHEVFSDRREERPYTLLFQQTRHSFDEIHEMNRPRRRSEEIPANFRGASEPFLIPSGRGERAPTNPDSRPNPSSSARPFELLIPRRSSEHREPSPEGVLHREPLLMPIDSRERARPYSLRPRGVIEPSAPRSIVETRRPQESSMSGSGERAPANSGRRPM